jgi:hypothetical protein
MRTPQRENSQRNMPRMQEPSHTFKNTMTPQLLLLAGDDSTSQANNTNHKVLAAPNENAKTSQEHENITPAADGRLTGQKSQHPHSIEAFQCVCHRREQYQRIIAVLSDGNLRIREQLEVATGISGNSLRPRIIELQRAGIVYAQGVGVTRNGRRAEKLGLTI